MSITTFIFVEKIRRLVVTEFMKLSNLMNSEFDILSYVYIETSLKIFKHYKLKPSFSIIKDEKDKVGVGDKPPPPSFNNLIKFDPI